MTTTTTEIARTPFSRAVIWTGIALGTCLAVLTITDGVRLRIGGMPSVLGVILGAVVVWALIVLAVVGLAELTRRHHRTVAAQVIRHGKRGAVATIRHARRYGGTVRTWLVTKAAPRWENREHQPLMFRRLRGEPESPAAETAPEAEAPAPEAAPHAPPPHNANGGTPSMTASRIAPERRARRTVAHTGGSIPSEWGPVVGQAADFEPESDDDLLDWMAGQVTGMAAYAEALIEAYETGVGAVGIDPKGLTALHDVADAAAHAAETMGAAKAKFTEHYELPREFAANGGLMTHDGRWVTGEGA